MFLLYSSYFFLDALSDITNANSFVVRKKLQMGAAIISLSLLLNSCTPANKKENRKDPEKNVVETSVSCYMPAMTVTDLPKIKKDTLSPKAKCHIPKLKKNPQDSVIEIASCYDVVSPVEVVPLEETRDDTLTFAEQMPSFNGGLDSMRRFISRNLNYPKGMEDICVSGRVILQFTVTNKGDIMNIKVLRTLHPAFDSEAIRVVKLMPKWIPGKQGGVERNVRYTLPVTFSF